MRKRKKKIKQKRKRKDWLNMNFIYPFTNNSSNLVLSTKVNQILYDLIKLDNFKRAYLIKYKPNTLGELTITSHTDDKFLLSINSYIQYNAKST
jgi:hypothetical protein